MRHSDWLRLYSELEKDKSDWSLCNQAVQNSVINIPPRVSTLTVILVRPKLPKLINNHFPHIPQEFDIVPKADINNEAICTNAICA